MEKQVKLLTIQQLAEALNVSTSWLYKNLPRIPHIRVGRAIRFDFSKVLQALEGGKAVEESAHGRKSE